MAKSAVTGMTNWRKSFRHQVGRLKNPRLVLQGMRESLGDSDPTPIFAELSGNPLFLAGAAPNRTPTRLSDMRSSPRLKSRGLAADLQWTAQVVAALRLTVIDFLSCEREFEDAYLRGDFAAGLRVLDEFEARQGLSNWLISRRITVSRLVSPSALSDYLDPLLAGSREGAIDNWLLYMIGYRADPNITPAAYVRLIDRALENANLTSPLRNYLRYHALSTPPRTKEECAAVMSTSENAALVDRYVALLDVLQCIACLPVDAAERATVARISATLAAAIPDDRIKLLEQALDPSQEGALLRRVRPAAADAYTAGDYAASLNLLAARLTDAPGSTGLYSLAARASLRAETLPSLLTCAPECYQSEVESGSFMMVG